MKRLADVLRCAREGAGLTQEAMARLLDVPEVGGFEAGSASVPLWLLERAATTFGVTIERFLAGEVGASPAALLFRSAAEHGVDLGDVLTAEDLRVLGDFLVCAEARSELEGALGEPPPRIPQVPVAALREPEWEQGQEAAEVARRALGLGDEPIPSMVDLLEGMGWALWFVTPDELQASVQGASLLRPRPAILVNLVGGSESWWRTRISLAHEMGHVLVDGGTAGRPYLVSPEGNLQSRHEWGIVERFRAIERRANAFAVHFLAPSRAVRSLVGTSSPEFERTIDAVCVTFGIGRTVAIRRLGHEFRLSEEAQTRMIARGGQAASHASSHPDGRVQGGLRRGRFVEVVGRAVAARLVDSVRARALLKLPMSARLPDGAGGEALVRGEALARVRAEAWLGEQRVAVSTSLARRIASGWEVEVTTGGGGGTRIVHLSESFSPSDGQ